MCVGRHARYAVHSFDHQRVTNISGFRVRQVDRRQAKNLCFAHILIFLLYVLSICFVISAAIVKSGLGLVNLGICRWAVFLCLSFYIVFKVVMYLFLIERAHTLRGPFKKRLHDWIWVTGFLLTVSGFTAIGVVAFWRPVADISSIDGRCRIGIPRFTTIPLVLYDVSLNILLTLVFVHLLSPLIRSRKLPVKVFPTSRLTECFESSCSGSRSKSSLIQANHTHQHAIKRIEKLLLKTLLGSILVMIPTVGNFVVLSVLGGRELGWVCLITCTSDVVWTVSIFHWLTIGSKEAEERPSAESTHRSRPQPTRTTICGTDTARLNKAAASDTSSTMSGNYMMSRDSGVGDNSSPVEGISSERVPGTPITTSRSLPCYIDLECVGAGTQTAPAALARSCTAPLPSILRSPSPPQRWSATASHAYDGRAFCLPRREGEGVELSFDPASRGEQP